MKKSVKIIISVAVAVVLIAAIITVSLIKGGGKDNESDSTSSATLGTTLNPGTSESLFDWDAFASQLALSDISSETAEPLTDANGNIITNVTDASGNVLGTTLINPNVNNSTTSNILPGTTVVYVYVTDTTNQSNTTTRKTTTTSAAPEMIDFSYTVDKDAGSVTLNRYTGSEKIVKVPATVSGYPVTAVSANCFASKNVESVYIGKNVETIGSCAFSDCDSLQVIYFMGSKITTLGAECFKNCKSIKSISLPDCITSIGANAFAGCSSGLVIRCHEASPAHDYALRSGLNYEIY